MVRMFSLALGAVFALAGAAGAISPLSTPATHAVILDQATGIVLYSKNGDEPMPPASMSKIMTVLLTFERIDSGSLALTDEVTVSENAWRKGGFATGGSTMCLEPKERVSIEDLLRGVIVLSGNDASIVLAETLAGSEESFALEANIRAEELGLENSHFVNATGWPNDEHRVSALDLARIARETIKNHPELYKIYAEKEFGFCTEAPSNRFNRNPVLGLIEGADGLKTGHTEESGYGLVASAERGGERRIIVFNGLTSNADRSREAERLLNAAFRDFNVATPFKAGDEVATLPVFMGEAEGVKVAVAADITIGYHRLAARDARSRVVYEAPLKAPIKKGDVVGKLQFEIPGAPVQEVDVVAGEAVARMGMTGRAGAALIQLIRGTGEDPDA